MNVYMAYTGSRWSEVIGLLPECVHGDQVAIDWKLYELNGRFYRGRPKDGSMRPADLPPFLAQLLADHLAAVDSLKCTCRNTEQPWCPGDALMFVKGDCGIFWSHFWVLKKGWRTGSLLDCGQDREGPLG
jgi:hypothetical protein